MIKADELVFPVGTVTHHVTETVTMRDQFAMAALPMVPPMISKLWPESRTPWPDDAAKKVAELAYRIADEMLKARAR